MLKRNTILVQGEGKAVESWEGTWLQQRCLTRVSLLKISRIGSPNPLRSHSHALSLISGLVVAPEPTLYPSMSGGGSQPGRAGCLCLVSQEGGPVPGTLHMGKPQPAFSKLP